MATGLLPTRAPEVQSNFREIENALNRQSESFASATTLTTPRKGQLWFDTTANALKYYNNSFTATTLSTGGGTVTSLTEGTGINLTPDTITGTGSIAIDSTVYRSGGTDVAVADGGSGASTLTGILKGNGTSAFTAVTAPSGALVGDTDTQTLSGKTLTTPTIASFTNATHTHADAAGGGVLTYTGLPVGACVQEVDSPTTAVATGTTVIPADDTIPQNTEGNEYMSVAITPKATTHRLVIQWTVMMANSAGPQNMITALFQDTTANALATVMSYQATAGGTSIVSGMHEMAAGTTSSTTFKIRAGANNAGTTTFNGVAGGRFFGAITKSSIVVTEYKA